MKYLCQFVSKNGSYTSRKEDAVQNLTVIGYSEDLTELRNKGALVHRAELDNQPEFEGYLGPMWNGTQKALNLETHEYEDFGVLRYETQAVYDMMSR